jgi:hypothetical protein
MTMNSERPSAAEQADNAMALFALNKACDDIAYEIKQVVLRKLNDSIATDDVLYTSSGEIDLDGKAAREIVLAWFQRITIEIVAKEFGEKAVAEHFESAYYQIASQHLGGDNFKKDWR